MKLLPNSAKLKVGCRLAWPDRYLVAPWLAIIISMVAYSNPAKAASVVKESDFRLVSNGEPACVVVVGESATPLEKLAVDELNKYIESLTGIKLNVISDEDPTYAKKAILIGRPATNKYISQLMKKGQWVDVQSDLGKDGYAIKTVETGKYAYLVLTGSDERGVLYSVYGLIEELLKLYTGLKVVDVDFQLDEKLNDLQLPPTDIKENPYCSVRGMELNCIGLSNHRLLDNADRKIISKQWMDFVDFCRRHRMNFITNWPYYGVSKMNNFPDIVILPGYKKISTYSEEEIEEAMVYRKQLLKYASANGVDPYLMIYVPGWVNEAVAENYPEFIGESPEKGWLKDKTLFCWGNPDVHRFMADLVREVVKSYPEAKGLHLRVWGGESAPCECHIDQYKELIQKIMRGMVEAAVEERPDIKLLLSGYNSFQDHTFEFARSLPGDIVFQRKWATDWEPVDDPHVPDRWLDVPDLKLVVSHSLPVEEATPFWFPSARLYQTGIQKYVKDGELPTLDGFPINSREWDVGLCDNDFNVVAMAKLGWDPINFNYIDFYRDTYANTFGEKASETICRASDINCNVMEEFLVDFGGLVEGMGFGNYYNMQSHVFRRPFTEFTKRADQPEKMLALYNSMKPLAEKQLEVVKLLEKVDPMVTKNRMYFENMLNVNKIWYYVMKARANFAEGILLEMIGHDGFEEQAQKTIELQGRLKDCINQMSNFTNHTDDYNEQTRESLLIDIDKELEVIRSFDTSKIKKAGEETAAEIKKTIQLNCD